MNHLYLLRQRQDLASVVLRAIDEEVSEAETVDDGYVEFEFIGAHRYLNEREFSRGANCTSVDAFMIGRTGQGSRRAFLLEWKYMNPVGARTCTRRTGRKFMITLLPIKTDLSS